MRPGGKAEYIERFIETRFVLEEVGVGGKAKPQRGGRRRIGGNRLSDAAKVGRLGRLAGKVTQVPANRRDLPGETLLRLHALEAGQQPVHQPRDDVRPERETRRVFMVVVPLHPRTLQEGSVRQDIG